MKNATYKKPGLRILSAWALALLLTASAMAAGNQSPSRTLREPGAGLLYYAKAENASADNTNVIANPSIAGALFQVIWSEVEKQDGVCDWSNVDRWLKPWLDAGKKVAIRVMWSTSGYWPQAYYKTPTPRWVWQKGAVYAFHAPSGTEIPLIWDPVYQHYAWRFLEQFAARYDDNPNLLLVDVTPGAETNPYRFATINRTDPGFKDTYEKIKTSDGRSYTEDLWLDTIKEWVDVSDRIFKHTPLLVTLNVGGLRGSDRLTTIGDYCVKKGFYVGQNGLAGNSYRDANGARTAAFLGWARQSRLFFEMVQKSGGSTGTLMEVMQAAGRIHCSYLNVYPEDVLRGTRGEKNFDPEFGAALKYGSETLGQPVPAASDAEPAPARRHGIYMMHPLPESETATGKFEKALEANPFLSGVLMHIGWSQIEATEGKYDFNLLDAAVNAMQRTGKDYGLAKYPRRLTLQTDQLDGRRDQRGALSYDILLHYRGRLAIGFQSLASFKNTAERQGSMELAAFNYVRAGAEYWELWRGDGLDPAITKRVAEALREAQSMSPDAYQAKLVERGLYRTAAQDTYPQKVQEMRRKAIEELEQQR